MTNNNLISKTIYFIRFPLIIGVIFSHYNILERDFSFYNNHYGLNNPEWFINLVVFISNVISPISVPIFFFISGFLFFYQKDFNYLIYKQKIGKRIKTLLIPYILWNIIAILNQAIRTLPIFASIFTNSSKIVYKFTLVRLFNTFFYCNSQNGIFIYPNADIFADGYLPINAPMWYIRDLMAIILISPIIFWFIKKIGFIFILLLCSYVCFIGPSFFPDANYISLVIYNMIFFSFGAYYSIKQLNFIDCFQNFNLIPFVFLSFALIDTFVNSFYIHFIVVIMGIISAIVIVSHLLKYEKIKMNKLLTNSSFFIFALHTLIIDDIGKGLIFLFHLPDTVFIMLSLYFIVPLLTIAICLLLYVFLKKYIPGLLSLLSGGR